MDSQHRTLVWKGTVQGRHTYPRRMINAKVDPYYHVCILDVLPPVRP